MQKLIVYIYIRHHLNSIIISCKDDTESRHSNCISNFHYYFSSKKVWKKNQTNSNLTSQRIPLQCRKKLSVFETSGLPTLMTFMILQDSYMEPTRVGSDTTYHTITICENPFWCLSHAEYRCYKVRHPKGFKTAISSSRSVQIGSNSVCVPSLY